MAAASASASIEASDSSRSVPVQPPVQFTLGKPEVPMPDLYRPFCLPLGPPTGRGDCFCELDGSGFTVRGRDYMADGVKEEAGDPFMRLRHVEFFRHITPLDHIAERDGSFLQMARDAGDEQEYLVIVYQTPGKTKIHLVLYFAYDAKAVGSAAPPHLRTVWERFMAPGADEYRRQRWKVIPRIAEGAWLVSSTVGTKPALLGTKMEHTWYFGDRYAEVDCNVMSSSVAAMIVGVIENAAKRVVIDLAFTIEGREEEELPEVTLGVARLSRMDLGRMGHIRDGMYGAWAAGRDAFDTTRGKKREEHDPSAKAEEGWLW